MLGNVVNIFIGKGSVMGNGVTYPQAPLGVLVDDNMSIVKKRFGRLVGPSDYLWFYKQVRNTGSWDFKQKCPHENFGNFHYGAVGYAGGIPANVLLSKSCWVRTNEGGNVA